MTDETRHEPPSEMKAGEKPRDSISELLHGEQNNGVTEEEDARREQAKSDASDAAERIHREGGQRGKQHL